MSKDEFLNKLRYGDLRKRIEQHPKMRSDIEDEYEFYVTFDEDDFTNEQIDWVLAKYPQSFVDDHELIVVRRAFVDMERYPSEKAYYAALVELLEFADKLDIIHAEIKKVHK